MVHHSLLDVCQPIFFHFNCLVLHWICSCLKDLLTNCDRLIQTQGLLPFCLVNALLSLDTLDPTAAVQAPADFTFDPFMNTVLREAPSQCNAFQNQNYMSSGFLYIGPTGNFEYPAHSAISPHQPLIPQQGSLSTDIDVVIISGGSLPIELYLIQSYQLAWNKSDDNTLIWWLNL